MYIDRLIKKEIVTIIVLVLVVLMLFFGLSYAYFIATDSGENNKVSIGDLDITFCDYSSCKNDKNNYGQIIGTKIVDGQKVLEGIYPYISDSEAIKEDPYLFNIKNTGSLKSYITIKLMEDKNYIEDNDKTKKVLYVTSQQFMDDYSKYSRKDDEYKDYFKDKYHNIDVFHQYS